ncbi:MULTISPECIES: MetQ/NlpA family ABC transporter substrate-binding protein [unclassified Brenneria]|uniref:MetQ/NlpA family ABC transporter substrate-binding protein n=1 Tax=unclassified Brenneria TaxID=2634434 RepID=UPI0029C5E38A|nr:MULTISPECIES: MetQ/NlpA family ABC transporter substrate-binding protein [unclassified Brenneria]MDX5627499.1 MetQ/NlpA family ABC transporter substrate-binding protein [Brenneria sp. L3-3Z]MDX5694345.1 MetQ/NlpA family ABC transporter substrate-binding protein [Brenneria sp. L4-2C]MEE3662071.1 MetQ/NlpA family ABC transporter substrate-binding protein [Brenneria sp. g21c3]
MKSINMKILAKGYAAALLALALTAQAADVVKIGSTAGATSDAVLAVVDEAKAQGIDVQLVEFTDWTLPNEALNNGDIDLNFFQHEPFLQNAIKERGYKLQNIGFGLLQNIGIYSNKITDLKAVPERAKVGVPNDPVNQGRGLLLLQKAGLIKLRNGDATDATLNDISENPKNLQFFEIEGPQLIRSLQDLDLSVVWPSYFFNAGTPKKASEALLYSGVSDSYYAMSFTARSDRANDPVLKKFVAIYQNSPAVRETIAKRFNNDPNLYALPWLKDGKAQ